MRGFAGALLALLAAWGVSRFVRSRLDAVEVRGRSMAPALQPGDRLLVARLPPHPGRVVLAPDPREPGRELIKRVVGIERGRVTLRGDNPVASTDARAFGTVPIESVAWRAVVRYWPPRRVGPIPAAGEELVRVDEGGEPACAFPEALIAGA